MGITFKKHPRETGRAGIGRPYPLVDIKLDKKIIGTISGSNFGSRTNLWSVGFTIIKPEPDDNPNCNWKWIFIKKEFETEEIARQFVIDNWQKIANKYQFHYLEY